KVAWTDRAIADAKEIVAYLASHDPSAAKKWAAQVRKAAGRLARFPFSGHAVDPAGAEELRETRVGKYRMFHHVAKSSVLILHLRHSAMRHPWEPSSEEE